MVRHEGLDLLKVIACFMVIIIHVTAPIILYYSDYNESQFIVANFLNSFSRGAVPIFVLISGGFLLSDDRFKSYSFTLRYTFKKIIVPTIFWSILYWIYYIVRGFLLNQDNLIIKSIKLLIKGEIFYHLWYLYMIIGIYLTLPILIKFIRKRNHLKITITIFFFVFMASIITEKINIMPYFQFINYLGYFWIGFVVKEKISIIKNVKNYFILAFLSSSLLIFILTQLAHENIIKIKDSLYFYEYLNPLVFIASVSLYLFFSTCPVIKISSYKYILKESFNIYLIHPFIIDIIKIGTNLYNLDINPFLFILMCGGCVLFISYLISMLINHLKVVLV